MTDTDKQILKDRIMFIQTALEVFVIDFSEEHGVDADLVLLSKKSNSLLAELKDKIQ